MAHEKHKKSLTTPIWTTTKTGGQRAPPPQLSPQAPALSVEGWPHGQGLLAGGLKRHLSSSSLSFFSEKWDKECLACSLRRTR